MNNVEQITQDLCEFYLAQKRIIISRFVDALSSLSDEVLIAQYTRAFWKMEDAKHPFSGIDETDRDVSSFIRAACYNILRKRGFEKGCFANDWRKKEKTEQRQAQLTE